MPNINQSLPSSMYIALTRLAQSETPEITVQEYIRKIIKDHLRSKGVIVNAGKEKEKR